MVEVDEDYVVLMMEGQKLFVENEPVVALIGVFPLLIDMGSSEEGRDGTIINYVRDVINN